MLQPARCLDQGIERRALVLSPRPRTSGSSAHTSISGGRRYRSEASQRRRRNFHIGKAEHAEPWVEKWLEFASKLGHGEPPAAGSDDDDVEKLGEFGCRVVRRSQQFRVLDAAKRDATLLEKAALGGSIISARSASSPTSESAWH
jgi:hypothetical protein